MGDSQVASDYVLIMILTLTLPRVSEINVIIITSDETAVLRS